MNYNINSNIGQIEIENAQSGVLVIPSSLDSFINNLTDTITIKDYEFIRFNGFIALTEEERTCDCGNKMHVNGEYEIKLKHLSFGGTHSILNVAVSQLYCPACGATKMQQVPFKASNHFITEQTKIYIEDLLATGNYNNKEIAYLTGVNRNIVKDIDEARLMKKYTVEEDGKRKLIQPESQAKFLGIDEFKLHNGNKYATHIIDLETGHILWIAEGKKKQVVYDFIDHVGTEWMNNVIAVACDMNSDFEEAFKEKCPHIKIVYDYFHIVKNLNEKVINPLRIDVQNKMKEEGDVEGAKMLKKSKYILTSNTETLDKKDEEAENAKVISKGNELFKKPDIVRKGGNRERYDNIINRNEEFLVIELIKELLKIAFSTNSVKEMEDALLEIMLLCELNGNKYLLWFMRLIYNHLDGIITHAEYSISTSKIEGINNKVKTVRRQAYGYPDDEYFFLKLIDMSRS